jgi:hypothetical protein
VRAAVRETVTSKVNAVIHHAGGALPGPLSSGLAGLAGDGVSTFMASPAFQQLWVTVNRFTRSQLISVLNGDSCLVTATGGEVVLNLLPLALRVSPLCRGRGAVPA